MRQFVTLPRFLRAPFLVFAILIGFSCASWAVDLPLAAGSPLAGFNFDDQPLLLPSQQNFQMALLTASGELGRSCGKMEAYGWRMKQSEQQRVDQIFNNTVERLRGLGFVVEMQNPSSVSTDITLFTADKPDKHFLFMWSAGEIGLVMALCETSPPLINRNGTASYSKSNPAPEAEPAAPVTPRDVLKSELKIPVESKASREALTRFSPLGSWVGTYICAQGYTGGTLEINSLKNNNFTGIFHFYATERDPNIPDGSYRVFGQYDPTSHRVLINPGEWLHRPQGYLNTIIVGSFDPLSRTLSAYFQGVNGCTSFEARYATSAKRGELEAYLKGINSKTTSKKKPSKKARPGLVTIEGTSTNRSKKSTKILTKKPSAATEAAKDTRSDLAAPVMPTTALTPPAATLISPPPAPPADTPPQSQLPSAGAPRPAAEVPATPAP